MKESDEKSPEIYSQEERRRKQIKPILKYKFIFILQVLNNVKFSIDNDSLKMLSSL